MSKTVLIIPNIDSDNDFYYSNAKMEAALIEDCSDYKLFHFFQSFLKEFSSSFWGEKGLELKDYAEKWVLESTLEKWEEPYICLGNYGMSFKVVNITLSENLCYTSFERSPDDE